MAISVIVLSFNSELTIEQTLKSAAQVSDDLHVVDSFSSDKTLEILKSTTAQVVQHEFESYGAQRNWSMANLPLKHPWQLHLDADEYLSEELVREIQVLDLALKNSVDGYLVPRKVRFLGKMLEHGGQYPKWQMRLFRTGKARCELRRYDQHFVLEGVSAELKNPMIDDHRMSLSVWTSRHNRWADLEVDEILAPQTMGLIEGRMRGDQIERKRALRRMYYRLPCLLRPFLLFFYNFVIRMGFLDGIPGLIYITLQVFWYRFLVDAKLYERRLTGR